MLNLRHRFFVSYVVVRTLNQPSANPHIHDHKDCFVVVSSCNDRCVETIDELRRSVTDHERLQTGESIVLLTWKWLTAVTE